MWERVVRIILRNRELILSLLLAFTLFMGYQATKVELAYELAQMLPESNQASKTYEEFKEHFGNDGKMMIIGATDNRLKSVNGFRQWASLTDTLDNIRGIDSVLSITRAYMPSFNRMQRTFQVKDFPGKLPDNKEQLEKVLENFNRQPFYSNYLITQEDSAFTTVIVATLTDSLVNSKERIGVVRELQKRGKIFTKKSGVVLHYSGLPYIRTKTMEKIRSELTLFIGLAALVLALILYGLFRSLKVVGLSLLVVAISVIWVFGFVSLFNYQITILTGIVPPLIIVIGIPNTVFLINKYHLEYKTHKNKVKALVRMVHKIGRVTLLTNITTAISFAAFILTNSAILIEFGVLASINILGVFILSLTLIPIISSYLKGPSTKNTSHLDKPIVLKLVNGLVSLALRYRVSVYITTLILLLAGIWGITKLEASGNMVEDIPQDEKLYQDLLYFEDHFNGILPFEVIVDSKEPDGLFSNNFSALYKIKAFEDGILRDSSIKHHLGRPLSINTGLKLAYQAYRGGHPKLYRVPHPMELMRMQQYLDIDETKTGSEAFVDSLHQMARISIPIANIGTEEMENLQTRLQEKAKEAFPDESFKISFTGSSVVFLEGTKFLIRNLFISLGLAIVVISIIMALMFSSYRMVLISLLPNLLPLIITGGVMGYFHITLKPSTLLVFSIAFGISVDDSIHFLAKFKQELNSCSYSIRESVINALRETGVSMVYTSIVLFFGFLIFAASSFGGTKALGLLVSTTLIVAMLTNLVLLPALLMSLERYLKKFRKYKRKSI
jgi:predicted RND superfamily exporter protein